MERRYYSSVSGTSLTQVLVTDPEAPHEVPEGLEEISAAEYESRTQKALADVKARSDAHLADRDQQRGADAAEVYAGAVGAGLPTSAATILARQVDPSFEA